MAKKDKDSDLRKELEAPDAFQVRAGQGLEYLQTQRRALVITCGVVLGVIVVSSIGYTLYSRSLAKAGEALGWASDVYARPVDPEGVPAVPERSVGLPTLPRFTSKEEKLTTAVAEWRRVQQEHSGPAVAAARLGEAAALYDQGSYDEAASAYRAFLEQASDEVPGVVALAREGLGYTLEAKGDLGGAAEAFRALASPDPKGFYADVGRFHAARILEKQGQKEQAISEYQAILADFPPSPFSPVQEEVKQHLRGLGVEPPPPPAPVLE